MTTERHASDGELVALLDGELETIGHVAAHVDTCAACSARLSLVWQRAAQLREVLSSTMTPAVDVGRLRPRPDQLVRARRHRRARVAWSRPGLRAAAGILLIAGVAAASPARTWIVDRVTAWRSSPAPRQRSESPEQIAPRPTPAAGAMVWFTPEAEELVIRFSVRPAGGSLALVAGDEGRSSAQIVAGFTGEAFLVLPTELRVRNGVASVAHYHVTLSSLVRRVRVWVGDDAAGEIATVDVTSGLRRVIQLGPSRRSP